MRLGLFTVLFPELELEELLELTDSLGIKALELSAKIGRGLKHFNPQEILESNLARDRFLDTLKRHDVVISQLNCSCNPISPDKNEEAEAKKYFENTFRLAEKLGVDTICSFSGCPGGGPKDQTPNWITCSWPPCYQDMLKYQWEEKLDPFWKWAAEESGKYGVNKLAIEMHPGFCVYNVETLLKLRAAVGPVLGANLDPSHLVWQGASIVEVIRNLKGAIWHFHAKDTYIDKKNMRKNGVLDTKHYSDIQNRSWIFRSVGYGMSNEEWREIISALLVAGYDGVISIEHEDILMSKKEGVTKATEFLKQIIPQDKPEIIWWA